MSFDHDDWQERFDALNATHNFRELAVNWHSGQSSAFYKFQCSGVVDPSHADDIASECRSNMRHIDSNPHADFGDDYERMQALECICDEYSDAYCSECGEEMDTDCNGDSRCPNCDDPCPNCSDGGGPI